MVAPGAYQVRLTAEGKSYTAPLELKVDPRVKTPHEDIQKQVALGRKIVAEVSEIHDTIGKMREARSQTKALSKRFADAAQYAALNSAFKDFDKKSFEVESQLLQVNSKSSEANLNYPVLIDERLHSLLFSVDLADAAPTAQQNEVFEELEKQARPLLAQAHDLLTKDLPALNESVGKMNIPAIYVPEGK
jgi:NTP pyrophosphatase (non-canonical NTP hydrolase)